MDLSLTTTERASPRSFGASLFASAALYGSVAAAVIAGSAAVRQQVIEPPAVEVSFIAPPPPPPPPPPPTVPPPASSAPTPVARLGVQRPRIAVPTDVPELPPAEAEPANLPPADPFAPELEGDPNGSAEGTATQGGPATIAAAPAPPAPPPQPVRPRGPIALPENAERPRPIHQIEPEIPSELRSAGVPQIRVVLRVTLDESGRVLAAEVLRGHPLMPDDNLLRAIRAWQFTPARVGGEAISAVITLPVTFRVSL